MHRSELIEETEQVVKTYKSSLENGTIDICITDKRLYNIENIDNRKEKTVIDLLSIDATKIEETKIEHSTGPLILIAALMILGGIILGFVTQGYAWFILSVLGIVLLVVGLIVSSPKYEANLIVFANGAGHPISVKGMDKKDVERLQKIIMQTVETAVQKQA